MAISELISDFITIKNSLPDFIIISGLYIRNAHSPAVFECVDIKLKEQFSQILIGFVENIFKEYHTIFSFDYTTSAVTINFAEKTVELRPVVYRESLFELEPILINLNHQNIPL